MVKKRLKKKLKKCKQTISEDTSYSWELLEEMYDDEM